MTNRNLILEIVESIIRSRSHLMKNWLIDLQKISFLVSYVQSRCRENETSSRFFKELQKMKIRTVFFSWYSDLSCSMRTSVHKILTITQRITWSRPEEGWEVVAVDQVAKVASRNVEFDKKWKRWNYSSLKIYFWSRWRKMKLHKFLCITWMILIVFPKKKITLKTFSLEHQISIKKSWTSIHVLYMSFFPASISNSTSSKMNSWIFKFLFFDFPFNSLCIHFHFLSILFFYNLFFLFNFSLTHLDVFLTFSHVFHFSVFLKRVIYVIIRVTMFWDTDVVSSF